MKTILKQIPLIISVIFVIVLSTGFFFLYKQINLNNEKALQSSIDFENETSRREEVKLLNNSIEGIKEDRASLTRHFAHSSDIVPFLDTIESLAPQVGAKAETVSVDILPDNAGLMVRLNVSGSFKSVYKFLTLLENSPYELEVVALDIQREASGEIDPTLEIVLPQDPKWQGVFAIKLLSFIP